MVFQQVDSSIDSVVGWKVSTIIDAMRLLWFSVTQEQQVVFLHKPSEQVQWVTGLLRGLPVWDKPVDVYAGATEQTICDGMNIFHGFSALRFDLSPGLLKCARFHISDHFHGLKHNRHCDKVGTGHE